MSTAKVPVTLLGEQMLVGEQVAAEGSLLGTLCSHIGCNTNNHKKVHPIYVGLNYPENVTVITHRTGLPNLSLYNGVYFPQSQKEETSPDVREYTKGTIVMYDQMQQAQVISNVSAKMSRQEPGNKWEAEFSRGAGIWGVKPKGSTTHNQKLDVDEIRSEGFRTGCGYKWASEAAVEEQETEQSSVYTL